MQKVFWYLYIGMLVFAAGIFVGWRINPDKYIREIVTNTNVGNRPAYYHAIDETNENEIYEDYKKYKTYPFVFVQNKDKMTAQLYDRIATEKIKQWNDYTGWIAGAGWDIMRTAPAVLAGFHWGQIGVMGQFTISSNFGAVIGGFWIFD